MKNFEVSKNISKSSFVLNRFNQDKIYKLADFIEDGNAGKFLDKDFYNYSLEDQKANIVDLYMQLYVVKNYESLILENISDDDFKSYVDSIEGIIEDIINEL